MMNYTNPNPYSNYPFNNLNNSQFNNYVPPMPPALNGKMVDGEEMVKATEVPIGGYGVFPKADLSEIYIKTWNPNGTTSVTTFRPVVDETKENIDTTNLNDILKRISALEEKVSISSIAPKKKEVKSNAY